MSLLEAMFVLAVGAVFIAAPMCLFIVVAGGFIERWYWHD